MKRLFTHLKYYTKESILGPLFKLFEATLELIVPLVIAAIIDNGIENADKKYVVGMSLVLVLLGAVGLAFSAIAQYFAAKASVGYATRLRLSLFSHVQKLSYTELDNLGTDTVISLMSQYTPHGQAEKYKELTRRITEREYEKVVFAAEDMGFKNIFTQDFASASEAFIPDFDYSGI